MAVLPCTIFALHFFFVISYWTKTSFSWNLWQPCNVPLCHLTCCLLDGGLISHPFIDKKNWMLLQIGKRFFWDVIQIATSTRNYNGPSLGSWTRKIHSVRPMRFVFRSEGYICFAFLRAIHFLTFKVWLPSAKFLYSKHICHSDVQCLGISWPWCQILGNP